ncbi:MAG: TIGR00341 family protein [Thermoanaerobaculia bacterium]|nr:TIGR00341 family protein [Thermoanaerobaculia bacterium]
MSERLIEILVPQRHAAEVERLVEVAGAQSSWSQSADATTVFKIVAAASEDEEILDALEPTLAGIAEAHVVVLPIEAHLPERRKEPENDVDEGPRPRTRLGRAELVADLERHTRTSGAYFVNTMLSALVAAIGLSRDNAAIVLAAMVIAPLLGPNMALALAICLGDRDKVLTTLRTGLWGLMTAAAAALLSCLVWSLDPTVREIATRTSVDLGDVALGLAAGCAGALAISSGVGQSLVGVMVAVALMPPLVVACGLAVGGHGVEAGRAALLLVANLVCLNLAALVTFTVQGIRPRGWWTLKQATRQTRMALALLGLLLMALVASILLLQF